MQISYLKIILYILNVCKIFFILQFPLRENVGRVCGKFDILATMLCI